jgi:hypothetical protein
LQTRLGSSLKNLEASWLGIRLRYLDDYRAVFDKWKEEDEPDEGVGLDRAPKKKKSRKGLKAMTIDTEPEKTVSTTTITTHENPKSWPPMIPSVLPGVPIDVIRDDPPKTPKKKKKEKESTPREKKKRSSMKKKKDENDSD